MATRTIRITISPFPRYAKLSKSKQGGDGFYNYNLTVSATCSLPKSNTFPELIPPEPKE